MAGDAVMVLGATGVFGSRICRLLARYRRWRVVAAGRDGGRLAALQAAIRRIAPAAGFCTRRLALPGDLTDASLRDIRLVIHAAGPFQAQDYAVAEACIARGVHYIDLADGRAFVARFGALDAKARAAGVLAVSGASSVPGLSGAVIAALRGEFAHLHRVAIGIAPGNRAPRGKAVVAAILGYVGQPVAVLRGGRWDHSPGWQVLIRRRIACPGAEPLKARWFACCDVPDLALLPSRYPELREVSFHASLELAGLHLGLWALSWPVRWGLLPSLAPAAGLLGALARLAQPFGSDRGGMFVELDGLDPAGRPLQRCWSLVAERGDGPWVPALPAALLARKLLDGEAIESGARPCLDLFTLAEIEREFARFDIATGVS